jgi:radical SAM superfamily enzyme YgiQ (UPF0313 family)
MNVLIFTDVNGVIGFGRYAGAYRVATELRNAGYSTQVIDFFANISLKNIHDFTSKYIDKDTLFIGFSTTLFIKTTSAGCLSRIERSEQNLESGHLPHDYDFIQEMFAIFKRKNPRVKIVIGGGKAGYTDLKGVDYWVWGQADLSIIALANHLKNGTPIITKSGKTGKIITNRHYPIQNYNKLKITWEPHDYLFNEEHLPIEINRGCIFRCSFCANPLHKKKGEYEKSLEILKQEFLYNYENFGTTGYMFCDDTYNDTTKKVAGIHKLIKSLPFKLEWIGYGRIDVINKNPEQRGLLLDSGLRAMLVGIETLHPIASKEVGKGLHPEKLKETLFYLKETWKNKVVLTGSFIIGLPGESEESIWKTVEWLQSPDCPLDEAIFSPLNIRTIVDDKDAPMSRIAKNPAKYGYTLNSFVSGTGVSSHGPHWTNEFMDKIRAEQLTKEIQSLFLKIKPVGNWISYSRLRNLGYSHEQIISKKADEKFIIEANQRKVEMYQEYLGKLLC